MQFTDTDWRSVDLISALLLETVCPFSYLVEWTAVTGSQTLPIICIGLSRVFLLMFRSRPDTLEFMLAWICVFILLPLVSPLIWALKCLSDCDMISMPNEEENFIKGGDKCQLINNLLLHCSASIGNCLVSEKQP